jgi:hypothetical protein
VSDVAAYCAGRDSPGGLTQSEEAGLTGRASFNLLRSVGSAEQRKAIAQDRIRLLDVGIERGQIA